MAKTFFVKFHFDTKIKTSKENVIPNTWILDLSGKPGFQHLDQFLGLRQKGVNIPQKFFIFVNLLVVYILSKFAIFEKLKNNIVEENFNISSLGEIAQSKLCKFVQVCTSDLSL